MKRWTAGVPAVGGAVVLLSLAASALPLLAETRPLETGAFAFDLEVTVPAPPERAFDAFTKETLAWWDHHFSEKPRAMFFDARPGGGFVEQFDDKGNGALHATVIFAERGKELRFTGPLGLSGSAVDLVHTLTFEPAGDGTTVKLTVHASGEYQKEWPALVEGVWKHFLVERFVPYVTDHPKGPGKSAADKGTDAPKDPAKSPSAPAAKDATPRFRGTGRGGRGA